MSSSSKSSNVSVGISPMFLLFLTFMVLKLTSVIDWSWWWVTAPLWGPLVLIIAIVLVCLVVAGICLGIGKLFEPKRKPIGMRR